MRKGQDLPSAEHRWFQRAPMDPLHGTTEYHSQGGTFLLYVTKKRKNAAQQSEKQPYEQQGKRRRGRRGSKKCRYFPAAQEEHQSRAGISLQCMERTTPKETTPLQPVKGSKFLTVTAVHAENP